MSLAKADHSFIFILIDVIKCDFIKTTQLHVFIYLFRYN